MQATGRLELQSVAPIRDDRNKSNGRDDDGDDDDDGGDDDDDDDMNSRLRR